MADGEAFAGKDAEAAESERKLGRLVGAAIPLLSVGGAVAVSTTVGLGPGVLVLLGGTLLGTVAFFWASLRTLTGEAPLPVEMESVTVRTGFASDAAERKRRVLRALKDLESERRFGKIDQADYEEVAEAYREEAKSLLRASDEEIAPLREKAEELAREYLRRRGLAAGGAPSEEPSADAPPEPRPTPEAAPKTRAATRVECPKCATSNEPDAAFCKKCGRKVSTDPEES